MKRTTILIGAALILLMGNHFIISLFEKSREPKLEVETVETTRYKKLESIIKSSEKFKDAELTPNEKQTSMNIDGKYDIAIKQGSYMMTIKDEKLEGDYCEIVDIIEQSLGLEESSIETCEQTLKGTVDLGGISAEIFENYKVLTVSSEEPAKLYKVKESHVEDELISTDEVDYEIAIEDFVFSSMRTNYTKDSKTYNVCGHVYNPKKKEGKFELAIYDEKKDRLAEKEYIYQNDTKKFQTFCIDFTLEIDSVKYYSIGEK